MYKPQGLVQIVPRKLRRGLRCVAKKISHSLSHFYTLPDVLHSVPFLIAEPLESLRYGGLLVTPGTRPFRVLPHLGPGGFLRRVLGHREGFDILAGKAGRPRRQFALAAL